MDFLQDGPSSIGTSCWILSIKQRTHYIVKLFLIYWPADGVRGTYFLLFYFSLLTIKCTTNKAKKYTERQKEFCIQCRIRGLSLNCYGILYANPKIRDVSVHCHTTFINSQLTYQHFPHKVCAFSMLCCLMWFTGNRVEISSILKLVFFVLKMYFTL